MESQHFIFDGIHSKDMNIRVIRMSTGFTETPYWGQRKINEQTTSNRLVPYLQGVESSPITFTLELALVDAHNQPKKWTPEERFRIADWLLHDTYKTFQTEDDLNKIYYAICTGGANLNLQRTEGYLEVTFRTNSPYAWSVERDISFNLSNSQDIQTIIVQNSSNVIPYYYPKLEIEMFGGTEVVLNNLTTGQVFKLTDLREDEIISLDGENRLIKSSYPVNINPLTNFNREWLKLKRGDNHIEVQGKCKIKMRVSFPMAL